MKYIKFIACMAAVAFSFTFTSCSSEDDDMEIVRTVTTHHEGAKDSSLVNKEMNYGEVPDSYQATTSDAFNK